MCLFLFNYSGRLLHGIYEAVGDGALNIDPSAWNEGRGKTQFPAQVIISSELSIVLQFMYSVMLLCDRFKTVQLV